jgi:hypothetical protein
MNTPLLKTALIFASLVAALLTSNDAHAFRCGSKIVRDGMHEQQVIAICGEPATRRIVGRALRGYDIPIVSEPLPGLSARRYPGYGSYLQEVVITEYVYNFGPRKLMQKLLFEGGVLVEIETIGYGYREK